MSVPRNRVGVAVLDEFLYAVGGSEGTRYHSSVERYVQNVFKNLFLALDRTWNWNFSTIKFALREFYMYYYA